DQSPLVRGQRNGRIRDGVRAALRGQSLQDAGKAHRAFARRISRVGRAGVARVGSRLRSQRRRGSLGLGGEKEQVAWNSSPFTLLPSRFGDDTCFRRITKSSRANFSGRGSSFWRWAAFWPCSFAGNGAIRRSPCRWSAIFFSPTRAER